MENGGSHSSMAGSAGKHCGDATAPAMAASVPNLNTDTGAERFTAALVPWEITLTRSRAMRTGGWPATQPAPGVAWSRPTRRPPGLTRRRTLGFCTATMWRRGGYNRGRRAGWQVSTRGTGDLDVRCGTARATCRHTALADVAHGVEQVAGLLGTGQGAVGAEPAQRRQRLVGPGHLQVGHRDQVIQAEQLEEDAGPVRAAQRAGEPLLGLTVR